MKKIFALLLCLLMILTCFVGCAKEETVEETTEVTEEVMEETTEETADLPFAGQTLNVWTDRVEGTPAYDAYNEYVEKYEAMTGADVVVSHYGTDLATVLGTALGAGEDIDVFSLGSQIQLKANLEYTMDLTEMFEASDMAEHSYPLYIEDIKNYCGGTINALPSLPSFNSFWFNRAAFEEVGITENPETFEEFEAACDKLVAAGYQPIALDGGYVAAYFGPHMERYAGQAAMEEASMNGGWAANEDIVAGLDKIIEWVNKGYFDENAPCEWPASQNKIGLTGETVMVYTGVWAPGEIEEMTGADLEWGNFKYPALPEGKGTYGTSASCTCNCISVDCDVPELAFDFMCYMLTGEADKAINDADEYIPADMQNEALPTFTDSVELVKTTRDIVPYDGGALKNADMKTTLQEMMKKVYAGEFATGLEAAQAFDALY